MARADADAGGWVERLVVFALVVLLVVIAAVGLAPSPGPTSDTQSLADAPDPSTQPPEFAPENARAQRLDASGSVGLPPALAAGEGEGEGEGDGGIERKTVLIDPGRLPEDDLHGLTRALTLAGHEVLIAGPNLEGGLARADAFLLFDPGTSYGTDRINATREFVDAGGRIVIFGEPNRKELSTSLFSVSITTVRSNVGPVANEFGIVFGRRYLYDTTRSDGNFKHVLAEGEADAGFDGTTAFYTATDVRVRNGTTVLATPSSTRLSTGGTDGPHAVAATAAGGDVLAVGDTTFVQAGRHTVGDNERFIRYVLEFALEGDLDRSAYDPNPGDDGGFDGGFGTDTPPATPPSNLSTIAPGSDADTDANAGTTTAPEG